MFSKNKLYQEACQYWKVRMGQSNTVAKKAEFFFCSMIIALELQTTDTSVPTYSRAMSWLLLLMRWGCMRMDDVVGIDVTRLQLTDVALRGVLVRTKTLCGIAFLCFQEGYSTWSGLAPYGIPDLEIRRAALQAGPFSFMP